MKEPEMGTLPAMVEILLFNDLHPDLTDEAKMAFARLVAPRRWVLMENGSILNIAPKEAKNKKSIAMSIDLDDPDTVRTFNLLPGYFGRKLSEAEHGTMQLRITVRLDEDQPYPFWSFDDTDKIIFNAKGMHLESVKNIFDATAGVQPA